LVRANRWGVEVGRTRRRKDRARPYSSGWTGAGGPRRSGAARRFNGQGGEASGWFGEGRRYAAWHGDSAMFIGRDQGPAAAAGSLNRWPWRGGRGIRVNGVRPLGVRLQRTSYFLAVTTFGRGRRWRREGGSPGLRARLHRAGDGDRGRRGGPMRLRPAPDDMGAPIARRAGQLHTRPHQLRRPGPA